MNVKSKSNRMQSYSYACIRFSYATADVGTAADLSTAPFLTDGKFDRARVDADVGFVEAGVGFLRNHYLDGSGYR